MNAAQRFLKDELIFSGHVNFCVSQLNEVKDMLEHCSRFSLDFSDILG